MSIKGIPQPQGILTFEPTLGVRKTEDSIDCSAYNYQDGTYAECTQHLPFTTKVRLTELACTLRAVSGPDRHPEVAPVSVEPVTHLRPSTAEAARSRSQAASQATKNRLR